MVPFSLLDRVEQIKLDKTGVNFSIHQNENTKKSYIDVYNSNNVHIIKYSLEIYALIALM